MKQRTLRLCAVAAPAVALSCSGHGEPRTGSNDALGTSVQSLAAAASTSSKTFAQVVVRTWPEADCLLHPSNSTVPADALEAFPDDLGAARFYAVQAAPNDPVTALSLDCHDSTGRRQSYVVDLTSASTFRADPAASPAAALDRPALTGDPQQYSPEYLWEHGYGQRPSDTASGGYTSWLKASSVPTRRVHPKPHKSHIRAGSQSRDGGGIWGGGMFACLNGSPGCDVRTYTKAFGSFYVPTNREPFASSGAAVALMWVGVGGWQESDLIQTGVTLSSSPSAYLYNAWDEYVTGNPVPDTFGYGHPQELFPVSQNDWIWAQAWACQSDGTADANGGFGCFFLLDYTTSQSVQEQRAQVSAYMGFSAEAIIEKNHPLLANYGAAEIDLTVEDSSGASHEYGTDNPANVYIVTLQNGSGTNLENVSLSAAGTTYPNANGTSFSWAQGS
jgi:hypothetical protein